MFFIQLRKSIFFTVSILTLFAQQNLWAKNSILSPMDLPAYRIYTSLFFGFHFLNPGKKQTVQLLTDGTSNRYVPTSKSKFAPELGLAVGAQFPLEKGLLMTTGLGLYDTHQISNSGDVYQFSDPNFNNFKYSYHLHSTRLMAEIKILKPIKSHIFPYVNLGLGCATNTASHYREIPKSGGLLPMQPFTRNTLLNLAYTAGLGVDFRLSPKWFTSLGYQYVYLGKAELGLSPSQTVDDRFQTKKLQAHTAYLSFTYLI